MSLEAIPVRSDTSPMQLFQMQTPALSQLGKSRSGYFVGAVVLCHQISSLLKFIGLTWSDEQIGETAHIAYLEYYWLTLAEIKQFFTRVKMGIYNSNKNINPAILLEFMNDYCSTMKAERYEYFSAEAQKTKWKAPENPVTHEVFHEKMEQVLNALKAPEEKTISETLGGEAGYRKALDDAIAKAKQLGIDDDFINKNKAK